jgi:sulfur carrier protein ThiS
MRRFAPAGKHAFELDLAAGASVAHMLERLRVPAANPVVVVVNGARAEKDQLLDNGDAIVLFTPAEGG